MDKPEPWEDRNWPLLPWGSLWLKLQRSQQWKYSSAIAVTFWSVSKFTLILCPLYFEMCEHLDVRDIHQLRCFWVRKGKERGWEILLLKYWYSLKMHFNFSKLFMLKEIKEIMIGWYECFSFKSTKGTHFQISIWNCLEVFFPPFDSSF